MRTSIGACLATTVACGMFMQNPPVPVDRLVADAERDVAAHPADSEAHYRLARVHYLAFALRADVMSPESVRFHSREDGAKKNGITDAEALQHLIAATREIRSAMSLDKLQGLYDLTLACMLEQGATWATRVDPTASEADWIEKAITEYKRAFELSRLADSKLSTKPVWGMSSLVSYESSESYIRLAKTRGPKPDEKETIAKMETHLKMIKEKPRGPITPIIFRLTPSASAYDLLDPQVTSTFDLDGTHRNFHWPWLKPDTAILVWDPNRTGAITSGRQLFGSVSWWIFWRDGYEALAALDDNRDGSLTGRELTGLALWFDRNQNGRSDPGEVIPIEQTQIESIRVTYDSRDGISPKSTRGLTLRDGTTLPTWDWIVEPLPNKIIITE